MRTNHKANRPYIAVCALLVLLCLAICGCGIQNLVGTGAIKQGSWQDQCFTNSWSKLKFTLPQGAKALNKQELTSALGAGDEIVMNDLSKTSTQWNTTKAKTCYDAYVILSDGTSNVIVVYENLALNNLLADKSYTADAYLDAARSQFEKMTTYTYTYQNTEDASVGGQSYRLAHYVVGDNMAQDYYVRIQDNVAIVLIVTYPLADGSLADSFLRGITAA